MQCPITLEEHEGPGIYSKKGLRYISSGMTDILPVEVNEYHVLHNRRNLNVLPALLSPTTNRFLPAGSNHPTYYLFADSVSTAAMPANMDVSLRVASLFGIETPVHGLVQSTLKKWIFLSKNPAAYSRNRFYPAHGLREFKNLEHHQWVELTDVAEIIEKQTSFPLVEKIKLLKIATTVFLIGDTSFGPDQITIMDIDGKRTITPVSELANMDMYHGGDDMHLRLFGKTGLWTGKDLMDRFGRNVLNLPQKSIDQVVGQFKKALRPIFERIETCFLPDEWKEEYLLTIDNRWAELGF